MRPYIFAVSTLTLAAVAACGGSVADPPKPDEKIDFNQSPTTKGPQSANPYTLFESLQTRPLALSPNRKLLFALNTPDNRLEIFKVKGRALEPIGSVEVGLEPVAIAV